MTAYDYNRPYIGYEAFKTFKAIDLQIAAEYGTTVIATELSNSEYNSRYAKFSKKNNMKNPPGAGRHKLMGWLVVRKYRTSSQYVTWMPQEVFEECYEPTSQ